MEWISVKDKMPSDYAKDQSKCATAIPGMQVYSFCSNEAVLVMAEDPSSAPSDLIGIAIEDGNSWHIFGGIGACSCTGPYPMIPDEITHWKIIEY